MCNSSLSESIQVLVCVVTVGLDHNIVLRLNINSFPPNTELYDFLCFHCYTLEGAIAHLSWMSTESLDQKHRRGRHRNEPSHMQVDAYGK